MSSQSEKLKLKIKENDILKIGGAFDAMSAKLVEVNGFDAVWAGSFAISATHAVPDASIMTMTEFLQVAKNMVDSCNIPIIADCDTGFGGPANVSHLVKQYEKAGVAGISIEDKIFPKQNSLLDNGKHELVDEKEFVAKIIAGKEAKTDQNFMIMARTDAKGVEGFPAALERAKAYVDAGADEEAKDKDGKTPLLAAVKSGHTPVVKLLLAAGPAPTGGSRGRHPGGGIVVANSWGDGAPSGALFGPSCDLMTGDGAARGALVGPPVI